MPSVLSKIPTHEYYIDLCTEELKKKKEDNVHARYNSVSRQLDLPVYEPPLVEKLAKKKICPSCHSYLTLDNQKEFMKKNEHLELPSLEPTPPGRRSAKDKNQHVCTHVCRADQTGEILDCKTASLDKHPGIRATIAALSRVAKETSDDFKSYEAARIKKVAQVKSRTVQEELRNGMNSAIPNSILQSTRFKEYQEAHNVGDMDKVINKGGPAAFTQSTEVMKDFAKDLANGKLKDSELNSNLGLSTPKNVHSLSPCNPNLQKEVGQQRYTFAEFSAMTKPNFSAITKTNLIGQPRSPVKMMPSSPKKRPHYDSGATLLQSKKRKMKIELLNQEINWASEEMSVIGAQITSLESQYESYSVLIQKREDKKTALMDEEGLNESW